MPRDADRNLLFGLLALQNGLIEQGQLVAAFQAWTRERTQPLAEHLMTRGDLDADDRFAIEALVTRHLKKHGDDTEKSLASIRTDRATREMLCAIDDDNLQATIEHVGLDATEHGNDRTVTFGVGTATSHGLRFRILRPHARGGLGAVFVALDSELHREVALKQILDAHADDAISRQRFMQEAEITGGLEHPGIVPVYGLGTYDDGRPYYAMRFIRGDSLKEAIKQFHQRGNPAPQASHARRERMKSDPLSAGEDVRRPGVGPSRDLKLRRLLRRFLDVCHAIEYAHSRGVLHRDIKPGNIIIGKCGRTYVGAFILERQRRRDVARFYDWDAGLHEPRTGRRRPRQTGATKRCLFVGSHALLPAHRQAAL